MIQELFFALLRYALWKSKEELPKELTETEISRLIGIAEEQTVMGLVGDALIHHEITLPRQFVPKIVWMTEHVRQSNQLVNEELKSLVKLPLANYAVVKGQTVASFYPSPLLRMSGDIDFLVRDYLTARSVLGQCWQVELPEVLIDKEIAFKHNGVIYEIHTELIRFGCRRHQRYWEELMKRDFGMVDIEGIGVPTLKPTIYSVYVFTHLFFHFIREGVGFRQMCDWAMVLHHYKNNINQDELKMILGQLGLLKAYQVFGCILVNKLGFVGFPIKIEDNDHRWMGRILTDILKEGNFGRYVRKRKSLGWRYKMETMRLTFWKCVKYWPLAPSELTMRIPQIVWLNVRLLLNK